MAVFCYSADPNKYTSLPFIQNGMLHFPDSTTRVGRRVIAGWLLLWIFKRKGVAAFHKMKQMNLQYALKLATEKLYLKEWKVVPFENKTILLLYVKWSGSSNTALA